MHTRKHPWLALWLGLGLLCQPLGANSAGLPALGDGASLSVGAERQIGDRIARELYRDPDYIEDPVLDEYVQQIWDALLEAARQRGELSEELQTRFSWRILLGKDHTINAFALPGGYLGLHLGLIATVTSRDEIASVLAHELSHVTQRHIARSMEAQSRMTPLVIGSLILGALAASKSAQGTEALIVGGQASAVQSQLSYSRDMEREADRIGFGVLRDAGFDPRGFVTMFRKLQQAAGVNDNGAYPYLRTHPLTTERIADMQARLPLQTEFSSTLRDLTLAMVSARARVLSQSQADGLHQWTQLPSRLTEASTPAQQVASLYAAALAWSLLGQSQQALQSVQTLTNLTAKDPQAARLSRLLHAEVLYKQGQYAQALPLLEPTDPAHWPRPELMATASALTHLHQTSRMPAVIDALRLKLQQAPTDAQAWQSLAPLLAARRQPVAALRAEAESQLARMDLQGALDRLRAAQDLARRSTLSAAENIEAAIVDTRIRALQQQLREQQRER